MSWLPDSKLFYTSEPLFFLNIIEGLNVPDMKATRETKDSGEGMPTPRPPPKLF